MGTIMEQVANVEPQKRFGQMIRDLRVEYEKRGLPLMGYFELTPHCNLDCKMCYIHRSDGKYPRRTLTGEEWIDIIDQAVDLGLMQATLTGGECTLHPDFKRIYTHLKKRGVYVSVLTNGTLLTQEMIAFLADNPPILLQISVYGSSPEVYERVTGDANAFYKVDTALRALKETTLLPQIELTISKYNLDDMINLWQYAHSIVDTRVIVDCDLFEPTVSSGHNFEEYALSYDEQLFVRRTVLELLGAEPAQLTEEDYIAEPIDPSEKKQDKLPCAAGHSLFHIGYDGIMMPCGSFPLAMSDVLANGVREAWFEINFAARNYRRSEECMSCEFLGQCKFCAARYFNASAKNVRCEEGMSCNKQLRMLIPILYKKSK